MAQEHVSWHLSVQYVVLRVVLLTMNFESASSSDMNLYMSSWAIYYWNGED
jgi:hypothetical protein